MIFMKMVIFTLCITCMLYNLTLQKERHLEPLPAGWFYNGSQYMDMSGEKQSKHPEFNTFLQQYVDEENESIREYNAQIGDVVFHDLFEC